MAQKKKQLQILTAMVFQMMKMLFQMTRINQNQQNQRLLKKTVMFMKAMVYLEILLAVTVGTFREMLTLKLATL